jgi:hypothetical protein
METASQTDVVVGCAASTIDSTFAINEDASLYQSGAESLNARAIKRSARATGHRRRLDRSPRLRTAARRHVVPVFVLGHCNAATSTGESGLIVRYRLTAKDPQ